MVKVGDKVWLWHFEALREVEVAGVTELQGKVAITYPGFISTDFFSTRSEAVEHKLATICSAVRAIPDRLKHESSILYLKALVGTGDNNVDSCIL